MSQSSKIIEHRLTTLEGMMTNAVIYIKTYMCCEHTREFSGMIKNQATNLSRQKMSFTFYF